MKKLMIGKSFQFLERKETNNIALIKFPDYRRPVEIISWETGVFITLSLTSVYHSIFYIQLFLNLFPDVHY